MGTPEEVAREPRSHTGHDLAPLLTKSLAPKPAHLERSSSAAENEVERSRKRRAKVQEAAE